MTIDDRDTLIRLALAPPPDAAAPAGLGDAIFGEVVATPQRRGLVRLRLGWLPAPSPLAVTLGLLAILALALAVAGLFRPPAAPILSTYHGGPDRTGVMPGPGPAGVGVSSWDVGRRGAVSFSSMPLPVGNRVFVADVGGFLAALDFETGALIWEEDSGSAIYGAPGVVDDIVVVGNDAGEVVAYRATTLDKVWTERLEDGPVRASLLGADGVIYVGTEGGSLFALAPADGHILWSIPVGGPVTRSPAFADGLVFVGAAGVGLLAVDTATRSVRWTADLGSGEVGTPAVAGGRVYVARGILADGPPHDLVALDTRDGRELWAFASPVEEQVHVGAIAHGRVYAVSEDGNLYALDPATGKPLWTAIIGGRLTTLATVAGDTVYVSSEAGGVVALDRTSGTVLWRVKVIGSPTMAAVVGGRAFVGTDLGRVVSIEGSEPPS
jgi:outer membrane protein assembly factor BamB